MPILGGEMQCFPADLLTECVLEERTSAAVSGTFNTFENSHFSQTRGWWVAHTRPRQEKSLARELRGLEIPYYLPTVGQTRLVRGRKQTSYLPLFTSYVFVYGNESERYISMTTNRIIHLLPVADPDLLSRELLGLSRLIASGAPLTVESRLKAGDRVRVKTGALAGVEGTVVARRRKCRLIVSVSLLQQGVSVEIDDHLLEPLG